MPRHAIRQKNKGGISHTKKEIREKKTALQPEKLNPPADYNYGELELIVKEISIE